MPISYGTCAKPSGYPQQIDHNARLSASVQSLCCLTVAQAQAHALNARRGRRYDSNKILAQAAQAAQMGTEETKTPVQAYQSFSAAALRAAPGMPGVDPCSSRTRTTHDFVPDSQHKRCVLRRACPRGPRDAAAVPLETARADTVAGSPGIEDGCRQEESCSSADLRSCHFRHAPAFRVSLQI